MQRQTSQMSFTKISAPSCRKKSLLDDLQLSSCNNSQRSASIFVSIYLQPVVSNLSVVVVKRGWHTLRKSSKYRNVSASRSHRKEIFNVPLNLHGKKAIETAPQHQTSFPQAVSVARSSSSLGFSLPSDQTKSLASTSE